MKRERALQVVLVLVGLLYFAWIYFWFGALWHSSWLNGVIGVALLALLPPKQPAPARPTPAGEPRFAER